MVAHFKPSIPLEPLRVVNLLAKLLAVISHNSIKFVDSEVTGSSVLSDLAKYLERLTQDKCPTWRWNSSRVGFWPKLEGVQDTSKLCKTLHLQKWSEEYLLRRGGDPRIATE
jgi:hypothetical protein